MSKKIDLNFDLNFFGLSKDSGNSGNPNGLLCTLFPEKLG